ncbi:hypothetical protein L596_021191 [Steinernema carpocapsae]|uniref:Uncharacterized protein n=1 Tax=Steinernema carpocapsae TaxID=34508 RepID=A0A4U5MWS6_STECR|nr:hypothetical protein L596_021191 [Steinernema carpocapsae]
MVAASCQIISPPTNVPNLRTSDKPDTSPRAIASASSVCRPDRTCDLRRVAEFNLTVSPRAITRICRGPRELEKLHESEGEFCWSSGSTATESVEAAAPSFPPLLRTTKCPRSRRSLVLLDQVHHRENCFCLDPSKVLVCVPECKGQLETIQDTP